MTNNIYSKWPWMVDTLFQTNFFMDAIRQIGWLLLIGVGKIVSLVYGAYMGLFDIDMSGIPIVGQTISAMNGIWPAILTLFLVLAGVYIIFGNKKVQKELASGLFLSIVLLVLTPFIFSTGATFLSKAIPSLESFYVTTATTSEPVIIEYVDGKPVWGTKQNSNFELADAIISGFVDDNLTSAQNDEQLTLSKDPDRIDINEKIGGYFGEAELFPYKILERTNSGKMNGKELKSDNIVMQDMLNEGLYRYNFVFIEPLVILLIMLVGILLAGLRTAKILFELIFNQTIAPLVFASDPYNAGRTKEFIKKIISTYIVLVVIFFLLMLFMSLSIWAIDGNNVESPWVRIMLIAGFAWGMIDGPDTVVKLLGIDAGVRSASAPLIATGMALGATGRAMGTVGRAAKGVASKIPQAAAILRDQGKESAAFIKKGLNEMPGPRSANSTTQGGDPSSPRQNAAPPQASSPAQTTSVPADKDMRALMSWKAPAAPGPEAPAVASGQASHASAAPPPAHAPASSSTAAPQVSGGDTMGDRPSPHAPPSPTAEPTPPQASAAPPNSTSTPRPQRPLVRSPFSPTFPPPNVPTALPEEPETPTEEPAHAREPMPYMAPPPLGPSVSSPTDNYTRPAPPPAAPPQRGIPPPTAAPTHPPMPGPKTHTDWRDK